jgi:3-oxoacyl-(acyl-carrier-protein) synthase
MPKPIYINGIHSIAPQACFENGFFDEELDHSPKINLRIIHPKYTDYIAGKKLRRMTKLMRLGLVGTQKVMNDAKVNEVDSIIIATGNGNVSDTQKFVKAVLDNGEKMLVPTAFVQSTNNIVAGSIALMLNSECYNMTYTHHDSSFEMALLDSLMLFEEAYANTILIGAIDEITDENIQLKSSNGNLWTKEAVDPLSIYHHANRTSALLGESSSFFILSNQKTDDSYAELVDVDLFYYSQKNKVEHRIKEFLLRNGLNLAEIDLVFGGFNGVSSYDQALETIINNLFPETQIAAYKRIVGEHPTSSAFAMWMAAQKLSGKTAPKEIYYKNGSKSNHKPKYVLILHKAYLSEEDYGLILLKNIYS